MNAMEHRVRERAYYIWEGEGRVIGRADAHWIQAEAELAGAAPVIEATLVESAAVAPVARKAAKVAPKTAAVKTIAKAAPKAATAKAVAPKAATKTKKAPRPAESGIALH